MIAVTRQQQGEMMIRGETILHDGVYPPEEMNIQGEKPACGEKSRLDAMSKEETLRGGTDQHGEMFVTSTHEEILTTGVGPKLLLLT